MNVMIKVTGLLFGTWISAQACQKNRSVSDRLQRTVISAFNVTTARSGIVQERMFGEEIDPEQVGEQEFFRDRMHSDVALVADCRMNDGTRTIYTVCCTPQRLKGFVAVLPQSIVSGRALIVGASDDSYNSIPDQSNVIAGSLLGLAHLGLYSAFVPCKMVPGSQDQNRTHLRVFVKRNNMSGRVVSRGRDIEFSL